jgi:uncharacterized membrane protein
MAAEVDDPRTVRARRSPVHPRLTDVPIGALVVAAVLDVISADGGGHSWAREAYRGATFTLMIGTAFLFLTIAAGLVDRARVTSRGSRPRHAVNIHAVVMTGVGIMSIGDLVLRRNHYSDAPHTPGGVLALTLITVAVMLVGGALGGKLVFEGGLGVAPKRLDARATGDHERAAVPDADV